MPELRAPDANSELPIASSYAYVELVDPSFEEDMMNCTPAFQLLDEIIACDVAAYLMYHTAQLTTYSQETAETMMRMSVSKKKEFKELTGKEYINKNIW